MTTLLHFLAEAVNAFPDRPAFQLPKPGVTDEWISLTYKQFAVDVHNYARYWFYTLHRKGVKERDVAVLW